jgi:hypothetical protein
MMMMMMMMMMMGNYDPGRRTVDSTSAIYPAEALVPIPAKHGSCVNFPTRAA